MELVKPVEEILNENEDEKEMIPSKEVNKNKTIILVENFIERIIDICAGIVGIIVLIPLTAIVYILSKIKKDNGPIFYTQDRIGKNGELFKMLKYRTMVVGADEILDKYLEENKEAREEYKKYKKLKNDPRVTKLGNFLRKTSLDEMPQLIHLLSGKMSLVGPRPYLPREKEDMGECYNTIIKFTPGITGPWQIAGRSEVTFVDRLDIDLAYSKNKSLKEDIKILFKTFTKVILREGAK